MAILIEALRSNEKGLKRVQIVENYSWRESHLDLCEALRFATK